MDSLYRLNKGDVVYSDLGQHPRSSIQSGVRPCVIVSCNADNHIEGNPIVNVCPCSAKHEKKKRKSHILITGKVDHALKDKFPDSEICGRFIIHPGETDWQTHISGKEVAVVNQDEHLYKYYNFDKLKEIVQKKTPDVHKKKLDKVLFCLKELSHESIDI